MNLADVFTFLFVILGFVIVYISYWLLATGLFPKTVERYAEQMGRAPVATTLLGAVTFAPLIFFFIKTIQGNAKVLGIALILLLVLAALFGSAGLALRIGQGLQSARDAHEPWRRVLRGGIVLALSFVMPFVGTLVVMPFAFVIGFGAFLIVLFRRKPLLAAQNESVIAAGPRALASEPPSLSTIAQ